MRDNRKIPNKALIDQVHFQCPVEGRDVKTAAVARWVTGALRVLSLSCTLLAYTHFDNRDAVDY